MSLLPQQKQLGMILHQWKIGLEGMGILAGGAGLTYLCRCLQSSVQPFLSTIPSYMSQHSKALQKLFFCFEAWWNWLCWRLFMFVWGLAQMAHLPFTCSAFSSTTPPLLLVEACATFRNQVNLSQEFDNNFLTSHFPCNPCMLCMCSMQERKRLSEPSF